MGRCGGLRLGLLLLGSCRPGELPPLGEALVIVDTDVVVPKLAGRMRIDLYAGDGSRWYESRDIARSETGDWPASFSIFLPEHVPERTTLVRVRIYPAGVTRDYRGERFIARSQDDLGASSIPVADVCVPSDDCTGSCQLPRLCKQGLDVTPPTEPQPFVTIDRLVLLHLRQGQRGSVRLTMRGACIGTMAEITNTTSCIDQEGTLVPALPAKLDPDMTLPTAIGKPFGVDRPCPSEAAPHPNSSVLFDGEVCVPGGSFLFGDSDEFGALDRSGSPQHVALLAPFYMDKYEVTIARWRAAMAVGFKSPSGTPKKATGPIYRDLCTAPPGSDLRWCSFTSAPSGQESLAVTCVSWSDARAFCQFIGGDLPTEAQWEWAAQVAGRSGRTRFPWGDGEIFFKDGQPDCSRVVAFRLALCGRSNEGRDLCRIGGECGGAATTCPPPGAPNIDPGEGPQAVDEGHGDISLGGVVGLGGGVSEYAVDSFRGLHTNCWASASLASPSCIDESTKLHSVRGGSWGSPPSILVSGKRRGTDLDSPIVDFEPPLVGFRCVRPVESP